MQEPSLFSSVLFAAVRPASESCESPELFIDGNAWIRLETWESLKVVALIIVCHAGQRPQSKGNDLSADLTDCWKL